MHLAYTETEEALRERLIPPRTLQRWLRHRPRGGVRVEDEASRAPRAQRIDEAAQVRWQRVERRQFRSISARERERRDERRENDIDRPGLLAGEKRRPARGQLGLDQRERVFDPFRRVGDGLHLVRTDHPLGAIAVYLCEPESDDGAVENGLVPQPAIGSDYPIARVR